MKIDGKVLTATVTPFFILLFTVPCFAQNIQASLRNYYDKCHSFYSRASETILNGLELEKERNYENNIKAQYYSFINEELADSLFTILESKTDAEYYYACFLKDPFGNGEFLYVFSQRRNEPLSKLDTAPLNSPDLYGVIANRNSAVFLYGDLSNVIISEGENFSRMFIVESPVPPSREYGDCYVFYIDESTILYIDYNPDEINW